MNVVLYLSFKHRKWLKEGDASKGTTASRDAPWVGLNN